MVVVSISFGNFGKPMGLNCGDGDKLFGRHPPLGMVWFGEMVEKIWGDDDK